MNLTALRAGTAIRAALAATAIMWAATAIAQNVPSPAKLSAQQAADAFGARSKVINASISPDGQRLAFITPGPDQSTVVQISDLASGSTKAINYADGNPLKLASCGWVSNTRLLCQQYGVSDVEGRLLSYSRLSAMDSDGTHLTPMGARERVQDYVQQSDGYVVDWLDGTGSKVLLARNYLPAKADITRIGSKSIGLGVDLIDTNTAKVEHIESADTDVTGYLSDGAGRVRMKFISKSRGFDDGERNILYRKSGSDQWLNFSTYSGATEEGLLPVGVDAISNVAYALKKTDGRDALYRVALDGTLKTDLIYSNPNYDVSGVVRVGRQGRIIGAATATDMHESVYFDPKYEKLLASLGKAIPNLPLIQFVDSNADETVHLIFASSDVDPGRYYVFDTNKKSLLEIAAVRPALRDVALGEVKAISYKAADGTMIPAYLTLPPGSAGKHLPAIVMPHGGPQSRDEWGFDWLAQFFVNRGFAVLQPNFRGSAGYGESWFQENGYKSWKIAIGDVNDAGHWLVKEGIAEPSKLAIFGWSYGGYAALQSSVVEPDLFKAIVAVAPVTDLDLLRGEKRGFSNMKIARDFIGNGPHIEEGSPARHADKIKAPVLIFHGKKDINVDVDESTLMDARLKKAGKSSELVLYPNLDHQLDDSNARAELLLKSDAFLRSIMKL